jgi:acyl-CoA synthetase (AMP-forming)/AMP-acid ligase II
MQQTLDDPHVFIPEQLASYGRFTPNKTAVICGEDQRTWRGFTQNIDRIANALIASRIRRSDKVVVVMGNSIEMLETVFGVVRAGGCVVPLSGLLTGEQMSGLIADCDATTVIASNEYREQIDSAKQMPGAVKNWFCMDAGVLSDREPSGLPNEPVADNNNRWSPAGAWLADAPGSPPPIRYRATDDFNIIYSSGTTGLPKGIVQTHRARLHWAFSNAIEMGFGGQSNALTTTALYSNGTWLMMLPVLFSGGCLVVMPAFSASRFLDDVEQHAITHTFMVPAQFIMVLAEQGFDDADLSSLQAILCAGSPLRRETKREVIEKFGNKLTELYGFSEGFATMLKPHQHDAKFATVGTPVMGFDIRILDDDGNELGPNEPGEIAGYGAGMMREYYGKPDQTAELIWTDGIGRTFIRSGDIGQLDDDGFLTLVDRKKDMIISGGFNVFPKDLEEVVGQHEAVSDVTVIGVSHERWGETPLALVILTADKSASDELAAKITEWANQKLAKHQRISAVRFRADFPRNALGKVVKRLLRDELDA